MFNRRQFLGSLGTAAGALTLPPFLAPAEAQNFETLNRQVSHLSPLEAAQNEDFLAFVKTEYTVSPNLLNLNNGGVCPQPRSVQDAHIRFYQYCNEAPSY